MYSSEDYKEQSPLVKKIHISDLSKNFKFVLIFTVVILIILLMSLNFVVSNNLESSLEAILISLFPITLINLPVSLYNFLNLDLFEKNRRASHKDIKTELMILQFSTALYLILLVFFYFYTRLDIHQSDFTIHITIIILLTAVLLFVVVAVINTISFFRLKIKRSTILPITNYPKEFYQIQNELNELNNQVKLLEIRKSKIKKKHISRRKKETKV